MVFLARHLPKVQRSEALSVNLIGVSTDAYRARADLESVRHMLEPEVRVNAALPTLDGASMERFSAARLNVVFRGFESVGEALRESLGMEYIAVDYPYGAAGSERFLREIDRALGCSHEQTLAEGRARAAQIAREVLHPLRMVYQAEAAVAGDYMRADALRRFLSEELGMRVTAYMDDRDPAADAGEWIDAVQHSGLSLIHISMDDVAFTLNYLISRKSGYMPGMTSVEVDVYKRQSLSMPLIRLSFPPRRCPPISSVRCWAVLCGACTAAH